MNSHQLNTDSLEIFSRYVAERNLAIREHYITLLAQDLSHQKWQGCFQRNVLIVLEQLYVDAFKQLRALPFDASSFPINNGLSDLTRQILAAFQGCTDDFLLFVVDKHRTSCALSNFLEEHKPEQAYVNEVRREVGSLWKNFALDVNDYVLQ